MRRSNPAQLGKEEKRTPGENVRNPKCRNASCNRSARLASGIENEYAGLKLGWTVSKEASVNTWGRLGLETFGLAHLNMKHRRSGDRKTLVQQKYETHAAPDQAQLYSAFLIDGTVQLRRHRIGAILGVSGNADLIPAQAFDVVSTALGLHLDQRTTHQAPAIDKFSRCHV
jgi:hypothetical protein